MRHLNSSIKDHHNVFTKFQRSTEAMRHLTNFLYLITRSPSVLWWLPPSSTNKGLPHKQPPLLSAQGNAPRTIANFPNAVADEMRFTAARLPQSIKTQRSAHRRARNHYLLARFWFLGEVVLSGTGVSLRVMGNFLLCWGYSLPGAYDSTPML
jgi:hypothetical protein